MKIRKIKRSDVNVAVKIVGMNYGKSDEKLARPELKAMFGGDAIKPVYLVAEEKGKVVGFAGYIQSWMDYNVYHIFWVNVHPVNQRQGIGQALIEKVVVNIKKNRVNLILLTTTSPKFYSHFGFKILMKLRAKDCLMFLKIK